MSVVYFCWLQGVSNQQRALASATDSKEKKKKKKLHLQKGQISADTSRLFENRVSGSLEFHFHLFILLSLNTIRYLFTHELFSATFKKTMNHLAVPSPFSVLLCQTCWELEVFGLGTLRVVVFPVTLPKKYLLFILSLGIRQRQFHFFFPLPKAYLQCQMENYFTFGSEFYGA